MQLRNNDALGAADDERTVARHQRDLSEKDFLFLDVPNQLFAGVGILLEDRQADRNLQGRREGHATFLTLIDVVFEFQRNRVSALGTESDRVVVVGSALRA